MIKKKQMKLFKILSIVVLVLLIITSIVILSLLANQYSSNRGEVEGTGFVLQELHGSGDVRYDVDDEGNIYFAVISPIHGIVIYNNQGEYKYTLPILAAGDLSLKTDEDNNILVYDVRARDITYYDKKGFQFKVVQDEDYSLEGTFPWRGNENVRERNGIRYVNNNGTITKYEDGVESVVFTVPIWQQWYKAFFLIMVLSCVALFLRITVPIWMKAYRDKYGKK